MVIMEDYMRTVTWILTKDLIDESQMKKFESEHGITFPPEYKECVLKNNGGRPRPNVFDSSNRKELVAKALLSFERTHLDNIWDTYENLRERLPEGVIPFMSDQFGNYICFDFRNSNIPSVVFWDHEQSHSNSDKSIIPIADGFMEFLNSLY